jgi:perosamine synthetase
MNPTRIPIAGPWITEKEIEYVRDAAATAWYEEAGSYVSRFESAFAEHSSRRFAISLPSCTSGLHLSLAALGVGPGDEVVIPDSTWIASAAPISYVGAKPRFADVDEETWCLTSDSFEALINERTKAVIPVCLYGGMPDMDALEALASQHGIAVIEDSAEAIGSTLWGRPAGSFGETSVFSFHGSKTLTTGEGGMVVTDREDLYERMLLLRDHGRHPGDSDFFNLEVGFKYKMSAMQAAMGLAQLERLPELVAKKRQIFEWYQHALEDVRSLVFNHEPEGVLNSYWMVTVVLDPAAGMTGGALRKRLTREGIDCRPFFHPLSSIPAYRDTPEARRAAEANPVSYRLGGYGLNLPSALRLSQKDVETVASAVRRSVVAPAPPAA